MNFEADLAKFSLYAAGSKNLT